MHTVSLRYFTVFGPRQRPDMSIHRLCEAAVNGTTFPLYGDGTQIREFTYVDDIVAGNLAAAAAPTWRRARTSTSRAAARSRSTSSSRWWARSRARRSPSRPSPTKPGDSFRNGGATDRARELLGWEPQVSLRDGIAAQVAWHRARR